MGFFFFGLMCCFIAIILVLAMYIKYKRQEEKAENKAIKEKYKKAAAIYESEKKQNDNIINTVNPSNVADKLQELSDKGKRRFIK